MKIVKYFFSFIFFLFLFFYSSQDILANQVIFFDDFSNNLAKWQIDSGQWNIETLDNNKVLSTSISGYNDTLHQIFVKDINLKNYIIEVKIKALSGVDTVIVFRVKNSINYYSVGLGFPELPLYPANYVDLRKKVNGTSNRLYKADYTFNKNQWYTFKLIVKDNNFKGYIDNQLVFDFTDSSNSFIDGSVGLAGWSGAFGNFHFLYDDFKITSLPSPTLFLPGLGGSWNLKSLLFDKEGGTWGKPPIDIYKNFRQTMLTGGYIEGEDYEEFYYNWRHELDNPSIATDSLTNNYLVKDLKEKIDNFYTSNGNQKINLVGHSLGGLLARAYAQRYGTEKINKIVTVGSPHAGAVKTYKVWEGGEIIDPSRLSFTDIFFEGLLFWRQKYFAQPTLLTTIRQTAPSLKNLLPTFDFLIDIYGPVKVEKMKQKNNLLFLLNQNLDEGVKNLLLTIAGKENDPAIQHDTLEWLQVMNPSVAEAKVGYWEDGKPYREFGSEDGDLTVLLKSATLSGVPAFYVTGNHTQIIQNEEGLNKIMQALELNFTPQTQHSILPKIPILFFWLHSPVNLKVSGAGLEAGYGANNCNNCYYSPENNLILINEAPTANYLLELSPLNSGGDYCLDIGQITDQKSLWYRLAGNISQTNEIYEINFDPQNPQNPPLIDNNGNQYLKQAVNKLIALKKYLEIQTIDLSAKKILFLKIDLALKFLQKTTNSSPQILSTLTLLFETRQEIDQFVKNDKLSDSQRSYLKNEIESIIIDLKSAYLFLTTENHFSNSSIKAHLEMLQNSYTKLEEKAQKTAGVNLPLGAVMTLIEQTLREAQFAYQKGYLKKSFISSFGGHFLIQEANKLL